MSVQITLTAMLLLSGLALGLHDTLQTPGEDLGIMDQVLWNTVHGHFMHQTICNPLSDSNCLGDVSRFAIHFEPILIAASLILPHTPSDRFHRFAKASS